MSSREFNQDAGGAKKAAEKGPVVITDRGRPAHALQSSEDYQKLLGKGMSLAAALAQKEEDIEGGCEFDPPRMGIFRAPSISTDAPPRYECGVCTSPA